MNVFRKHTSIVLVLFLGGGQSGLMLEVALKLHASSLGFKMGCMEIE